TEVVNVTTVEKDNDLNGKNSNDSGTSSASNNTLNVKENLSKPIKMKEHRYLCSKSLENPKFISKNKILNECLRCNRTFRGGKSKIEHVLRDHMMLEELKVLECMYCFDIKSKSEKYLDVSSVQDHYKEKHKVSKKGCPNNFAKGYNDKEQYIHVNGSADLLLQFESQFVKCFTKHC
uniref:C2H2-type domain-containing protein n=1 Tax=Strongyloides papillosus TaxID=174720 RepID=A0A0N5BKS9_STREA